MNVQLSKIWHAWHQDDITRLIGWICDFIFYIKLLSVKDLTPKVSWSFPPYVCVCIEFQKVNISMLS